jgi:hypothetical protein
MFEKCTYDKRFIQNETAAVCWWLTPAILATQEAEIRRVAVKVNPDQ